MVNYRYVLGASMLACVNAVPLNINLGAYSPALVVGDGEISFGGAQNVNELMNALEGAAVNSAVANTASTEVAAPIEEAAAPVEEAAAPAEEAASSVKISKPKEADPASDIALLASPSSSDIGPREDENKAKRDLAGFDRALVFAEAALTKGPDIQLGTGAEGSGVGIIVDNNPENVAPEAKKLKRDVVGRRAKITTMYVRRGVPASMQDTTARRSVPAVPVVLPTTAKRQSSEVLDAINLNMPVDEGVTMTFVEETDVTDDE